MTSSPISAVSPMTTPIPWSMKNRRPMAGSRATAASTSSRSRARQASCAGVVLSTEPAERSVQEVLEEDRRQIPLTERRDDDDDELAPELGPIGDLDGRPDRCTGRDADEQSLLRSSTAGGGPRGG